MGIAIWCDVKDSGHPFNEREAIIVNPGGDAQYFCQAHCIPAFVTAFHTARKAGQAAIFLPTLGGAFTVMPSTSHPTSASPPGNDEPRTAGSPDDGQHTGGAQAKGPGRAAGSGMGRPPRGARSRETAQAIAGLLEQTPPPGATAPMPANYGGRA